MAIRPSTALRNAMAAQVAAITDAGAGAGVLQLRTGAQPANGDAADAGTLLASFTLADPSFTNAGGVATLDADPDLATVGVAAGTAAHFRIKDSTGANVTDGSVTTSGGGGDLIVDNTNIAVDQTVTILTGTITVPAG